VLAVLGGKLTRDESPEIFAAELKDRAGRLLWKGEVPVGPMRDIGVKRLLEDSGFGRATDQLNLADALARARLTDVVVTDRKDFALPDLPGMAVFPLASRPFMRLSGEFEVINPGAPSAVQSRTKIPGGDVGFFLRQVFGTKEPPRKSELQYAWMYYPFNWISERELLIRYEPIQPPERQDRSPVALNLASAFVFWMSRPEATVL